MRICVIAGGVGSARLCTGLVRAAHPADITVIANIADDEVMRGLHISPDVDSILYHLAGLTYWERGWGMDKESFVANDRYRELASRLEVDSDLQEWFALGDRDLATHMLRTRLLDEGHTLGYAIDALRRAMGIEATVLPASDNRVRTKVETTSSEHLDFQTYFVRRQQDEDIASVVYEGAESAAPAPGVIEAMEQAEVLLIGPSNPILSVEPILAVPRIRETITSSSAARIAVSPIIGGKALKGPADRLLDSLGHEASAAGVARYYGDLIDTFVLDGTDEALAGEIKELGLRPIVCDTIMSSPEAAGRLAATILDNAT
jgi:LPPG:FO 2-phospho-L-lactate transferase